MAQPSLADIQLQEKLDVDFLEECLKFASVNAKNVVTMGEAIQADLKGDYVDMQAAALADMRARMGSMVSREAAAALLYPNLLHLARINGWPERDAASIMGRRYKDYIDNARTVQSRVLTIGAVAAGGGNSGTGTVYMLSLDENDLTIEATSVETKTFTCLVDYNLGSRKHEEQFEARGEPIKRNALERGGSSLYRSDLRAQSAADSAQYLSNPSFSTYTGTTPPTALPGWTPNSGVLTNLAIITGTGNYYRDPDGDTATAALKFTANELIYQVPINKLAPGRPYHLQIAWMRLAGATGNLTIRLGNASVAVAIGTGTNNVWNVLTLVLDKKRWPKYFNKQGLRVEIEVDTLAVGTVAVDDVILVPMTQLDGRWWTIMGGATPFLRDDVFTQATTQADTTKGKKQYWLSWAFQHYLPHTAGAATDADP